MEDLRFYSSESTFLFICTVANCHISQHQGVFNNNTNWLKIGYLPLADFSQCTTAASLL